jgi:hypothetical protein
MLLGQNKHQKEERPHRKYWEFAELGMWEKLISQRKTQELGEF